jgi:hypothetical protein
MERQQFRAPLMAAFLNRSDGARWLERDAWPNNGVNNNKADSTQRIA